MNSKYDPHQHGFTLIETMTVVAVIGILAAIALPAYDYYVYKARAAEVIVQYDRLRTATAIIEVDETNIPICQSFLEQANAVNINDPYVTLTVGFAPLEGQPNDFRPVMNVCASANKQYSMGSAQAALRYFQRIGKVEPNLVGLSSIMSYSVALTEKDAMICRGIAPQTHAVCGGELKPQLPQSTTSATNNPTPAPTLAPQGSAWPTTQVGPSSTLPPNPSPTARTVITPTTAPSLNNHNCPAGQWYNPHSQKCQHAPNGVANSH
nr:prepilin-type N-terminal cleavage/methylation domain-containing protein [Chitinibacter sp. GC72]